MEQLWDMFRNANSKDTPEYYPTYILNRYAQENKFRSAQMRLEKLPTYAEINKLLPQPIWEGHESTLSCYWKVWEIAFRNLRLPTAENGFVSPYIDTAFNGNLFMWDSCFILMFARYGQRAFNFQQTLDNFYAKQHLDGFICREIRETDGKDTFSRFDPPATGPDVMPWAEWEYYRNIGDKHRLADVFPALLSYHHWYRRYRTWQDGTYWACGWACGMDNQPRLHFNQSGQRLEIAPLLEMWDTDHMAWIDACAQAVLSARILVDMAEVLGRNAEVEDLLQEIDVLKKEINTSMWDESTGFYYDRRPDGTCSDVKTIGAFWTLLAGIVPTNRLNRFITHLEDTREFNRPHRVPSLSADHPEYNPLGDYWRGSIWAPTNYVVLRGLTEIGNHSLAHEIGLNHLKNVVRVYENTGTLWENYAPEQAYQGNVAAKDFVGWTGLPPVAVLFEYVFGLRPDVPANKLIWDVRLTEAHGVERYPFGETGLLDLHCSARLSSVERPVINAHSNTCLTLEILWDGGKETLHLDRIPD